MFEILLIYTCFFYSSLSFGTIGYDEKCNPLFKEGSQGIGFDPDNWVWPSLLPDGTFEYERDIYHFKRTVFIQK